MSTPHFDWFPEGAAVRRALPFQPWGESGNAGSRRHCISHLIPLGRDSPGSRKGIVHPEILDVDGHLGSECARHLAEDSSGRAPRSQDDRLGEANDHPRAAELVRRGGEPAYDVVGRLPLQSLGEELLIVRISAEPSLLGRVRSAPQSTEQEQVEHAVR